MSEWTGFDATNPKQVPIPIFSGSINLPCDPKIGCSNLINSAMACYFNQPCIGLTDPINFDDKHLDKDFGENGYTMNVHRQIGSWDGKTATGFDPSSSGHLIGSFYYGKQTGTNPGFVFYIDAGNYNPSKSEKCC